MQTAAVAKKQGSNVRTAISLLSCSMMRVHTLVLPLAVPPATPAHMEGCCCRCRYPTAIDTPIFRPVPTADPHTSTHGQSTLVM